MFVCFVWVSFGMVYTEIRKWISVSKMIKPIKKGIVYLSKTSVLLELLGNLLGEHLEKPSFYICIESGMSLLAVFLYPLSPQTFFTCFASHKLIYFSGQSPARFNRTGVLCFSSFLHVSSLNLKPKMLAWLAACWNGGWMLFRFRKTRGLTVRGTSIWFESQFDQAWCFLCLLWKKVAAKNLVLLASFLYVWGGSSV